MVIAPARTGKDNKRRIVVINTDQIKSGVASKFILRGRIFIIVTIKLIELRIEEAPAI